MFERFHPKKHKIITTDEIGVDNDNQLTEILDRPKKLRTFDVIKQLESSILNVKEKENIINHASKENEVQEKNFILKDIADFPISINAPLKEIQLECNYDLRQFKLNLQTQCASFVNSHGNPFLSWSYPMLNKKLTAKFQNRDVSLDHLWPSDPVVDSTTEEKSSNQFSFEQALMEWQESYTTLFQQFQRKEIYRFYILGESLSDPSSNCSNRLSYQFHPSFIFSRNEPNPSQSYEVSSLDFNDTCVIFGANKWLTNKLASLNAEFNEISEPSTRSIGSKRSDPLKPIHPTHEISTESLLKQNKKGKCLHLKGRWAVLMAYQSLLEYFFHSMASTHQSVLSIDSLPVMYSNQFFPHASPVAIQFHLTQSCHLQDSATTTTTTTTTMTTSKLKLSSPFINPQLLPMVAQVLIHMATQSPPTAATTVPWYPSRPPQILSHPAPSIPSMPINPNHPMVIRTLARTLPLTSNRPADTMKQVATTETSPFFFIKSIQLHPQIEACYSLLVVPLEASGKRMTGHTIEWRMLDRTVDQGGIP